MDVHMNELLQATIDEGGSDLHIRARMPPELRVHGELCPLSDEALTEEDSYTTVPAASPPSHGPCYPWEADHSPGDCVCAQGERGKALGWEGLGAGGEGDDRG